MSNYSRGLLERCEFVNDGIYEGHNFSQKYPHTAIGEGFTGLKFENCNLVNCDVPADTVVVSCNTTQISRCGNIEGNDDYECAAECKHLVSSEDVMIDGVVIDTLREYADKVVS
jgi:hypothetical protein